MRAHARLILVLLALFLACSWQRPQMDATAARDTVPVCSPAAQDAFDAGNLDQARGGFMEGLLAAVREGALERAASCRFYLGLVAQTAAQSQRNPRHRRALLATAVRWYESAHPAGGMAPGLVGNLAVAYRDLGETTKAEELLDGALAGLEGAARASLARSAAGLFGPERWPRAVELYRSVLDVAPTDDESRAALFALLAKWAPEQLPGAIWDAVDAGRVLSAQRAALDGLEKLKAAGPTRVELLAALVGSLAKQSYDPRQFATSEAGVALVHLAADPLLGEGARQLLVAHTEATPEAQRFSWWGKRSPDYKRSPLYAFRSLLRSLAVRMDHGDPRLTQEYLEAAERLAPGVPDTELWVEEAHNQFASGDFETVLESMTRWDRELGRSGVRLKLNELVEYRRSMAEIRTRAEVQLAHLPSGGGGGFGGGGGGRWAYIPDGGCTFGPGGCALAMMQRIVPELPTPANGGTHGAARMAVIEVGCGGRRAEELGLPGRGPDGPVAGVKVARFVPAGPATERVSNFAGARPLAQPLRPPWRRVALGVQPAWLSSAAWDRQETLVLDDSLRRQLLRIGDDGSLRDVIPGRMPRGDDGYVRVQRSQAGEVVAEEGSGHLVFDVVGTGRPRAAQLVGRRTVQGKVMSVFQWTVMANHASLAVANLLGRDGIWRSAVVRAEASGEAADVVHPIGLADPDSNLYRVGIPALAGIGDAAYLLALEEDPIALYELRRGERARKLRTWPAVSLGFRRELNRRMTPELTAELFALLEGESFPAGIFAQGDALYLLERRARDKDGSAVWELARLEPVTGRVLAASTVPTTAPFLSVAPGEREWAFFEKNRVAGFGRQAVPSMLLVSSSALWRGSGSLAITK